MAFFFFVNLISLSSQFYGRLSPRRFYYVCNILLIAFSVSLRQYRGFREFLVCPHTKPLVYPLFQVNFIQQPLPKGSKTGAGGKNGVSGALGQKQETSTGLTTLMQFW